MWAVSNAIARDSVFTKKTARWIGRSALLLFADAGIVFATNVVMLFLSFSHPSVLLAGLIVTFVFIALGLLAAVLSRYIQKAADLQETSEGTI
jgi:predicted membrane-bound spermidine synthase